MKQLPLGVRLQDRALFGSFFPGSNSLSLAAARSLAAGTGGLRLLYLHGLEGAGKSHLLQATCAEVPGSAYLPMRQLRQVGPGALEGLEGQPLLAIDDPEAVAGDAEWERRLLVLYESCATAGTRLAVAAAVPAVDLPLQLPDLRSRLAAMPHYALRPLDEAQQREALKARAAARGLELGEETLDFLQRRVARDMGSLHAMLERLDAASLAAQRPLTVPFVRQVLGQPE